MESRGRRCFRLLVHPYHMLPIRPLADLAGLGLREALPFVPPFTVAIALVVIAVIALFAHSYTPPVFFKDLSGTGWCWRALAPGGDQYW
ncbi:MAG: hypothetical protein A2749_00610 [Parcubacteria group bacterium RIFCSPHIGHO2_01_FULL_45_26]|nr:MAG: hypothetical protein A2749_00610 [Parcubacteria group bacterium RIFCSPHIGHO2_01_FULL_45_26]